MQLPTFHQVTEADLGDRVTHATGMTLDEVMEIQTKPPEMRANVLLQTACSAECNHCFYVGASTYSTKDRPVAEALVDELLNKGMVIYVYPKEPSVAPQTLELLKRAGQDNLITNARIDFDKVGFFPKLIENGIRSIAISLPTDTSTWKEVYNGSPQEYEIVLRNIARAKELGFKVGVYSTLHSKNTDLITNFIDSAVSMGVSYIVFTPLIPMGNGSKLPDELIFRQDNMVDAVISLDAARQKYDGKNGPYCSITFSSLASFNFYSTSTFRYLAGQRKDRKPNGELQEKAEVEPGVLCPALRGNNPSIAVSNGQVFSCNNFIAIEDLGVSYNPTMLDMPHEWFNLDKLMNEIDGLCGGCSALPLCQGGCRTTAYFNAVAEGHPNPLYAGQQVCVTRALETVLQVK